MFKKQFVFVFIEEKMVDLSKQKSLFDVIFREKPALMLTTIKNAKKNTYASTLAKEVDCTYSHIVKVLTKFEKQGLVTFEKQGRLKYLALTKKGYEVAELIEKIKNLLL
jgi:DNA-binding MarR family transcriptional regulator